MKQLTDRITPAEQRTETVERAKAKLEGITQTERGIY